MTDFQNVSNSAPVHQASADGIDILAILQAVWYRKGFIIACMLLAAVASGYYAFRVAEPEYRAKAVVEFSPQDNAVLDLNSIVSGTTTDLASLNTEIETIRSREMIEALVDRLSLMNLSLIHI